MSVEHEHNEFEHKIFDNSEDLRRTKETLADHNEITTVLKSIIEQQSRDLRSQDEKISHLNDLVIECSEYVQDVNLAQTVVSLTSQVTSLTLDLTSIEQLLETQSQELEELRRDNHEMRVEGERRLVENTYNNSKSDNSLLEDLAELEGLRELLPVLRSQLLEKNDVISDQEERIRQLTSDNKQVTQLLQAFNHQPQLQTSPEDRSFSCKEELVEYQLGSAFSAARQAQLEALNLRATVEEKDEQIEALQKKVTAFEKERDHVNQKSHDLETELYQKIAECNDLKLEIEREQKASKKQMDKLRKQHDELESKNRNLKKRIEKLELDSRNRRFSEEKTIQLEIEFQQLHSIHKNVIESKNEQIKELKARIDKSETWNLSTLAISELEADKTRAKAEMMHYKLLFEIVSHYNKQFQRDIYEFAIAVYNCGGSRRRLFNMYSQRMAADRRKLCWEVDLAVNTIFKVDWTPSYTSRLVSHSAQTDLLTWQPPPEEPAEPDERRSKSPPLTLSRATQTTAIKPQIQPEMRGGDSEARKDAIFPETFLSAKAYDKLSKFIVMTEKYVVNMEPSASIPSAALTDKRSLNQRLDQLSKEVTLFEGEKDERLRRTMEIETLKFQLFENSGGGSTMKSHELPGGLLFTPRCINWSGKAVLETARELRQMITQPFIC